MVAMTTCVHTDQIWLGYVTFFGPPTALSRFGITWSQVFIYHMVLVSPGNRWPHVVTYRHNGKFILTKSGWDKLLFWPPIANCRFGITWSQVVTYGHTGHLGMVSPGNSWSHEVKCGHLCSQ